MFSLDDLLMGEVVTMPFVKHVQSSPWIFFWQLRFFDWLGWAVKNSVTGSLKLGGGNSNIFYFHPENWGNDPI